ncbi:restriction endonuclease subunit S [Parvimonas micra]|uniref:restriction endonuclease subunit S n=1 Tax=Parvimonas micra TaxID=33033 RepID=UPI001E4E250B|nr:restriction endonuclease subunit S [Parvimonas micra]MCE3020102.1 restriction endonuclease subunit S [Parvimonas micra]
MNKNNNVPKIRFEGFNDSWEQCKLGEVGSLKNGMNFSKDAMGHGFPFVNLQNIFGKNMIDVNNLELAEASDSQIHDYNLKKGDVLFVRSSVKLEGVGEAAVVPKNLKNTTYSGFIIRFRDERGINNDFKRYVFSIPTIRNQIMAQATNSANKNISQSVLEKLELLVPQEREQELVGSFFSALDHLITLHQSKYEKLLDLKKSMLYKLFPKEGETIPEMRFEGFSGAWEKRRLGDCFSERIESFPDGELLSVTINSGIKKFSELDRINNSNENKTKYKKVYVGDIVYNSMRMWQGASGYSPFEGIVSPAYTVLRANEAIDAKCFSYLFKKTDIIHMFQMHSKGITSDNWNLKYPDFKELEVYVSQDYEEQKAIGEYFSKLDKLIDLNKAKLEKLKNIKSLLLDKMFV